MLLALLEAQAGLRAKGVAEGGSPDADRIEDRGLHDDVGRGIADLGPRAAHDPGDPERPDRVGDEQRVRVELAVDVIERLEPLPGAREADDDPALVDGGRIERVDRLAELEHHVVADVDDVADRPLAGRDQAHLDVVRRRPDGHARHAPSHEPGAQGGLFHLDASERSIGSPVSRGSVVGEADRRPSPRRPRGRGRSATARRRGWA